MFADRYFRMIRGDERVDVVVDFFSEFFYFYSEGSIGVERDDREESVDRVIHMG